MGKWAGLLALAVLGAPAWAQDTSAAGTPAVANPAAAPAATPPSDTPPTAATPLAETPADQTPAAIKTITLPDGRTANVQAQPGTRPADGQPGDTGEPQLTPAQIIAAAGIPAPPYTLRADRWSEGDEREYGQFIAELGESGCATVDKCLHDPRNPFRGSDPPGVRFFADCADLPYYLRYYFAWKRGLPFSFVNEVVPRGHTRDMRYTAAGNRVEMRLNTAGLNPYGTLDYLRGAISSATYRIHPELEAPGEQDFYSPALTPKAIRPGTVIYDPNGHLATVWKVERNGRIHYLDAHPDYSVTRGFYDVRFVRSSPGMGAGFKNWRPQRLVGGKKMPDGTWQGGTIVLAANKDIPDYSLEQFFGTGKRPDEDRDWKTGTFTLNNETVDYYDYVRGQLAGGSLLFDPVREIADLTDSNCADLHYRADAVNLAIAQGLHKRGEPDRLPPNIYGTDGDWEEYSTPSRDARLKTAFKELYDTAQRFQWMAQHKDPKLAYKGQNLAADMLNAYDTHAALCSISYTRSNGAKVSFGYEEARRRLFQMSFDPYQCPELRWGAKGDELASCPDGADKRAWYEAEKYLRYQIDRTYDARMDFSRDELKAPGPGKGVPTPPETDVRSWLLTQPGVLAALKAKAKPAKEDAKNKPWWWPL
jgi:hypothetical protein